MTNLEKSQDPYFEERLTRARHHKIIGSIEVPRSQKETESKKELPNPTIEGEIFEFGWSEKCVRNFMDAFEKGLIRVERLGDNRIRVEFLPLHTWPEQLGHVAERDVIVNNLAAGNVFGSLDPDKFTYLQTTDFAVEGYMDDEEVGKLYGRVYVDSAELFKKRNVYLDPESLNVTDYEYGYSFCVRGGVPFEAISRIDLIRAKKMSPEQMRSYPDFDDLSPEAIESLTNQQVARLKDYIERQLSV